MIRRPPRSTRTDTLFPYTTLFRSSQFDVQKKREQPVRMTRHPFENRSVDCLGQHLSRLGEQLITIVRTAEPCLKRKWIDQGRERWRGAKHRQKLLDTDRSASSAGGLRRHAHPSACFMRKERSEERRVGKECVSTGRSRWS